MRTANSLSRAWLVVLTLILGATSVFAEAPHSAVEFNAMVQTAPNGGPKFVTLYWYMAQEGTMATSFDVYMAKGETEDETAFEKIGTVETRTLEPRGKYTFKVENLDAGIYTFYVVAVNADGSSDRTRIKVVNLNNDPVGDKIVKFTTEPRRTGEAGVAYRYEAKATTNTDGAIVYSLAHGPEGMTINASTGLVEWATPRAGRYEVKIIAKVMVGGIVITGYQSFVLEIKGEVEPKPEACVAITGTVTLDGTDTRVVSGVVVAWRTHGDVPANVKYEPVYKAEVRQGTYTLRVPAGAYKLRVEGPGFHAEWYADVKEIAEATTIEAVCTTPTVEINFSVEARAEVKTFVVSGRIVDAATGNGLKGIVKFSARLKEDVNIERNLLHVIAETNAEGYYEVRLAEGIPYIAYAQETATPNTISLYLGEYWEETSDATAATRITLTENLDGINFTLERRPDYDNGFSGRLLNDETNAGVKGKVTAYLVKSDDHKELNRKWSVTVETNEEGDYAFENLIPGNYVVLGIPAERPLVPGWYVTGGRAEIKWQNATQIEVAEVMVTMEHDIRLHAVKGEHGRGHIHGWVFDKRGGIVAPVGKVVKGDAQVQNLEENGIIGALVVATVNGEIVDFTFSENDGAYELSAMGSGDAVLNINRFDYDHATMDVTVDGLARIDQQLSFGLAAVVSGVEVPVDRVGKDIGLYPNPATSTATVSFTATTGTAIVKVVDMQGVVLFTNVIEVTTGLASAELNLSSVPAGMVMVHVSNGTSSFALPLSIHR